MEVFPKELNGALCIKKGKPYQIRIKEAGVDCDTLFKGVDKHYIHFMIPTDPYFIICLLICQWKVETNSAGELLNLISMVKKFKNSNQRYIILQASFFIFYFMLPMPLIFHKRLLIMANNGRSLRRTSQRSSRSS